GVDIILGPEMRSTGEVMGLDKDFAKAFAKSQFGAGMNLPKEGTVFISVKNRDKDAVAEIAKSLSESGFKLIATAGTQSYLVEQGLEVTRVNKVLEGRPHCVDAIINGDVQMVINTTEGAQAVSDSFSIRRSTLTHNVSYYTTITAASAMATAIATLAKEPLDVAPLQSYFN
ncbi:MAG: carbamoyl phosphate synthase large subunit, partial [Rhodospirillales bacterium]|nr:carbamoyl phosphate synthase large subunit [Rhodospirillales bacterium]